MRRLPNKHKIVGSLVAVLAIGLVLAPPAAAHGAHVVEPGDTLSEIAEATGTSVVGLMAENDLASPHRIRVGQTLVIPHRDGSVAQVPESPASAPTPAGTGRYVVQPGDTLSQIAERLGVSTSSLVDTNGLSSPHRIRVGQELIVPGGGVSSATYANLPERIATTPDRLALVPIFERWAAANDIPVDLLMSLAWQESGWNTQAVSHKGAVGVGQIMPATGRWVAADLIGQPDLDTTIAEDNIRISARYLRWLLDYLGSEDLALAGYYQGPGAVRAGIMYDDTVSYIANVQVHRQFFQPS